MGHLSSNGILRGAPFAGWLCVAALLLSGTSPSVVNAGEDGDTSAGYPSCLQVSASTPYRGYGYSHLVTIESTCDETLECKVSSNVDPSPEYDVTLKRGDKKHITTRIGSPSREFQPRVTCTKSS